MMADTTQGHSGREIEVEQIVRRSVVRMPEGSRERIRHNVLSAAASQQRPVLARAVFTRAAAAFTALTIGLGGVSYAAASALPGSPLYPVKRAMEEARVALQLGETNRAEALVDLTRERVRDVERLMEQDADEFRIERAAQDFGDAAQRAVEAEGDVAQSRERVEQIEEGVEDAPNPVRQRVADEVPAPSPEPDPVQEPSKQQQQQEPADDAPAGSDDAPGPGPDEAPNEGPGTDGEPEAPKPGPGPGGSGSSAP